MKQIIMEVPGGCDVRRDDKKRADMLIYHRPPFKLQSVVPTFGWLKVLFTKPTTIQVGVW